MGTPELLYALLGGYTTVISYDASGNPEYIGEAQPGSSESDSVWRIFKITYNASSNPTNIQWADGVSLFTKIWDDKASYDYS
ncbi:hypothetical protein KKF61_07085 [Patescibacteria group bacterium]|nr:hypothetical protein [Patescibacteria group bacterium]